MSLVYFVRFLVLAIRCVSPDSDTRSRCCLVWKFCGFCIFCELACLVILDTISALLVQALSGHAVVPSELLVQCRVDIAYYFSSNARVLQIPDENPVRAWAASRGSVPTVSRPAALSSRAPDSRRSALPRWPSRCCGSCELLLWRCFHVDASCVLPLQSSRSIAHYCSMCRCCAGPLGWTYRWPATVLRAHYDSVSAASTDAAGPFVCVRCFVRLE